MFAKQNAQSSNPKVRMLAAEKRFTAAEVSVQRAERDLERAVENAKRVKLEPSARVWAPAPGNFVTMPSWLAVSCSRQQHVYKLAMLLASELTSTKGRHTCICSRGI